MYFLLLFKLCRAGTASPAGDQLQPRRRMEGSALVVRVVVAPPETRLVASPRRAVEPLVHAPEAVQSARIGGIGVIDDAVLAHERAHAWPLARVRRDIGSGHGRILGHRPLTTFRQRVADPAYRPRRLATEIVFDALALLLLGEGDVEVEVEVAAERRRPGKRPVHPPLIRLQLAERRPRHRAKRDVVVRQVSYEAVEPVRNRRAGRTPRFVVGTEHEVVDEELRASSEEVCQRRAPLVGVESIFLVDPNPRQRLPPPRHLVAAPRQFLLGPKQFQPGRKPLFTCSGLMVGHRLSPSASEAISSKRSNARRRKALLCSPPPSELSAARR